MPYFVGFVTWPAPPVGITVEFWDRVQGALLVSHTVHTRGLLSYQHYFPDDYFVKRAEDLEWLFTDIVSDIEIIPRFGDRNPMTVW